MLRRLLASIALVLIPATAGAERLSSGVGSVALWTDNELGTAQDGSGGEAVRVLPWADLEDREGRVTWGLRYAPTYEYYLDEHGLNGFNHDVGGRFAWRLGDRTTFSASERFQRHHGVTSFNDQAAPGEDIVAIGERQSFVVNNVSGSLVHQLGPVDQVSLSVSQSLFDYSDESQLDHNFLGANVSYNHTLSERATVGTVLSWGRQTTDRLIVSDDVTDYYNLSGVLTYAISPTSQLSLSAGPALIQGNSDDVDPPTGAVVPQFPLFADSGGSRFLDADTCPEVSPGVHVVGAKCKSIGPLLTDVTGNQATVPFVGDLPGVDDSNTTYFASAALTKQWERWSGALGYTRSASDSSVVASVSDVVYGDLSWRITQRWTVALTGSFERREQASENFVLSPQVENVPSPLPVFSGLVARSIAVRAVEVDNDAGVDFMTANFRVAYQLTTRTLLQVNTSWYEQSGTGNAGSLIAANRVAVTVGLNYSFDSVNF